MPNEIIINSDTKTMNGAATLYSLLEEGRVDEWNAEIKHLRKNNPNAKIVLDKLEIVSQKNLVTEKNIDFTNIEFRNAFITESAIKADFNGSTLIDSVVEKNLFVASSLDDVRVKFVNDFEIRFADNDYVATTTKRFKVESTNSSIDAKVAKEEISADFSNDTLEYKYKDRKFPEDVVTAKAAEEALERKLRYNSDENPINISTRFGIATNATQKDNKSNDKTEISPSVDFSIEYMVKRRFLSSVSSLISYKDFGRSEYDIYMPNNTSISGTVLFNEKIKLDGADLSIGAGPMIRYDRFYSDRPTLSGNMKEDLNSITVPNLAIYAEADFGKMGLSTSFAIPLKSYNLSPKNEMFSDPFVAAKASIPAIANITADFDITKNISAFASLNITIGDYKVDNNSVLSNISNSGAGIKIKF